MNRYKELLSLPKRDEKDRLKGLNVIIDSGLPVTTLESIFEASSEHIDMMEISPESFFVTTVEDFNQRVNICKQYDITPFLSGFALEVFLKRNKFDAYIEACKAHGLNTFQVSTGCFDIDHLDKCKIIEKLAGIGTIYSRIGSMDVAHIMPPYKWIDMIKAELKSGASYVFAEGGKFGNIGIYRGTGEVREGLIDEILGQVSYKNIIFDAPQNAQQQYFIENIDYNCNISRLHPQQILEIEAMRLGLHPRTFHLDFSEK